ncbi:MAG: glycosyltransferase family 4 protein [Bacteroidota bacterium]
MKKTIYILAPYPKGEAPSQRFRFEQYLDRLEKEGYTIEFYSFLSEKAWKTLYQPGNVVGKFVQVMISFLRRWRLLFKMRKADHVFVHREMAHIGPPVFEWISSKMLMVNYIYDFDDAIWLPNYSQANARFQRLKAYWKVKYCMKWAHKVTAGNDYLADFARKYNRNVQVIPTTIDLENHHNRITDYNKEPIAIGWTGTHTTMRYLSLLVPVLQKLEKEYNFEFMVISNEKPDFKLKSLRFIPWNKKTEIEDLSRIQIGVMPLVEDQWSAGKCGFKALQYMALGIPTLLSPVGVNKTIVTDQKNGLFCATATDWENNLRKLLEQKALRESIGKAGRARVQEGYSVSAHYQNYLRLFQ